MLHVLRTTQHDVTLVAQMCVEMETCVYLEVNTGGVRGILGHLGMGSLVSLGVRGPDTASPAGLYHFDSIVCIYCYRIDRDQSSL